MPLLPISFLRRLIRLYDNNMQSLVPHYLERTIESFGSLEKNTGIEKIEKAVKQNMEFMQSGMQIFNPFNVTGSETKQDKLKKIKELEDQIEKLKSEI